MNPEALVSSLERFADALPRLVRGIDAEDARRRSGAGQWSILEILGHLGDEERDDFRPRLASTLTDPSRPWAPIDPERSVRERGHQEEDLDRLLRRFLEARRGSISWLRGLGDADWSRTYSHPSLGPLSAGGLLASWAAHDHLHLRQLAGRFHALCDHHAGGHSTAYAGPWS